MATYAFSLGASSSNIREASHCVCISFSNASKVLSLVLLFFAAVSIFNYFFSKVKKSLFFLILILIIRSMLL